MLGIGMVGPGALAHRIGIYFRADLRQIGANHPALMYFVPPPEGAGVVAAVNLADLWLYMAPFRPDQGERVEAFDVERCVHVVRAAVGVEDLEVEVLSALPWALASAVAEGFREGRVFLAGDASHLIPPAGGQAMNVGIQDVHNLAWKLAARLGDWGGDALLDTYETERRPSALAVNDDVARNVASGVAAAPSSSATAAVCWGSRTSPPLSSPMAPHYRRSPTRSSTTHRQRGLAVGHRISGSSKVSMRSPHSTSTTPHSCF
jgi:2-polyprenyl-6-methoxyphenol hydroxylase-like FAD-dependent oxidoreductase